MKKRNERFTCENPSKQEWTLVMSVSEKNNLDPLPNTFHDTGTNCIFHRVSIKLDLMISRIIKGKVR